MITNAKFTEIRRKKHFMNSIKFLLALLVFLSGVSGISVFAQSKHPLLEIHNQFLEGKMGVDEAVSRQLELLETHTGESGHPIKCATPLFQLLHREQENLSEKTKAKIDAMFSSSTLETKSYVSASGKFIIYYETTGPDAIPLGDANSNSIPDYVEWTAEAADSSYRHEVITLGFTDPIPSGSKYSISFKDTKQTYGFIEIQESEPAGTKMTIENDYVNYPENDDPEGDQKGSLKVTVAHEFKHAIQYAQTGFSGDSEFWVEMDATLMEEVVYDNVNRYYGYYANDSISDLFSSPIYALNVSFLCFAPSFIYGCYEDVTWALYFHERFGERFWTGVWDKIEANNSILLLDAIEAQLTEEGASFNESVLESYMWHFASGDFSRPSYGFDERAEYPSPSITQTFTAFESQLNGPFRINEFSARYFLMYPDTGSDGFLKIDFQTSSSSVHVGLLIFKKDRTVEPYYIISPVADITSSFTTDWKWENIEQVGIVVLNANTTHQKQPSEYSFSISDHFILTSGINTFEVANEIQLAQNFPNPFNPETVIQIAVPFSQTLSVKVYDYLGREVQTLFEGMLNRGSHNFRFDGSNLASGTYYYRLVSSELAETKKMLLIK